LASSAGLSPVFQIQSFPKESELYAIQDNLVADEGLVPPV